MSMLLICSYFGLYALAVMDFHFVTLASLCVQIRCVVCYGCLSRGDGLVCVYIWTPMVCCGQYLSVSFIVMCSCCWLCPVVRASMCSGSG